MYHSFHKNIKQHKSLQNKHVSWASNQHKIIWKTFKNLTDPKHLNEIEQSFMTLSVTPTKQSPINLENLSWASTNM